VTPDWQLAFALTCVWIFLAIILAIAIGSLIHTEEDFEREAIEAPRNHVEAYLLDPDASKRTVADEAADWLVRRERFHAWLDRNGMSIADPDNR
jgi:hypothetical protein